MTIMEHSIISTHLRRKFILRGEHRLLCLLPILLFGLLLGNPAAAGNNAQIVIERSVASYPLSASMEILEDRQHLFSIKDITQGSARQKFKPFTAGTPNFGNTASAFWFRTLLINSTTETQHIILEEPLPFLDSIDLFTPDPNKPGEFRVSHAGDHRPFAEREIPHPGFLFNLTLAPGEKLPVHIRVASRVTLMAPFIFWLKPAWDEHAQSQAMAFGSFFGILLVLILFSLCLFLFLRDPVYPLFALFSFSIALMFATTQGLSYKYLWPDSPWLAERMQVTSITFVMFAGTIYARSFLNTAINLPQLDRMLRYFLALLALIIGLSFIVPNLTILATFSFILIQVYSPLLLFTGYLAKKRGVPAARFYLLAWCSSLVGAILASLTIFNILPYHFVLLHATSIGFLLDAGLLSLAMADRIHIIRTERDLANQRAHDTLLEAKNNLNSEVERRTHELITAKREADSANQAKTQFLANMSHELRTPLTSIVGYSELLLSSVQEPLRDNQRSHLEVIYKSGLHLNALIDDVLDVSNIESGNLKITMVPVSFRTVLTEVLAAVRAMADHKSVRLINTTAEKHSFRVIADRVRLRQVTTNLITNAIKYSPDNSDILLSLHRHDGRIRFSVTDHGPGIATENLERIFSPFTRLEEMADKVSGIGIGLNISKKLTELMAGEITVNSRIGQGTSFHVDLVETARIPMNERMNP